MKIDDPTLNLSKRALNVCKSYGIHTVEELKHYHETHDWSFYDFHNCGKKTIMEFEGVLDRYAKSVESSIRDWEKTFDSLSLSQMTDMQESFNSVFLNDADSELYKITKILELTPLKALILLAILRETTNIETVKPGLCHPLIDFEKFAIEIASPPNLGTILASADDIDSLRIYDKFSVSDCPDQEFIESFYSINHRLPLFRIIVSYIKQSKTRNINILSDFLGLNGSPLTLEQIGQKYDRSRERARQIVIKQKRCIKGLSKNYLERYNIAENTTVESLYEVVRTNEFSDDSQISFYAFNQVCEALRIPSQTRPNFELHLEKRKPQQKIPKASTELRILSPKSKIAQSPKYCRLQIETPEGEMIETGNSNFTFLHFIMEVGWERVRDLQITFDGESLITDKCKNGWYKEIVPGTYLYTKMPCTEKIAIIRQISDKFDLSYKASMTDPLNSDTDKHRLSPGL